MGTLILPSGFDDSRGRCVKIRQPPNQNALTPILINELIAQLEGLHEPYKPKLSHRTSGCAKDDKFEVDKEANGKIFLDHLRKALHDKGRSGYDRGLKDVEVVVNVKA